MSSTKPAAKRRTFSKAQLARRGLWHYRGTQCAVLLSTAAATAIIAGALVIGDSVHSSLRARVEERLGRVDRVVTSAHFFREALAVDLTRALEEKATAGTKVEAARSVVPVVLMAASVVRVDEEENVLQRVAGVHLYGVPLQFWGLSEASQVPAVRLEGFEGRRGIVNDWLARQLGAEEGQRLLVTLEASGPVPSEHALGDRGASMRTLPVDVHQVVEDRGVALLDFRNSQDTPRNLFVPLDALQRFLKKRDRVNGLLIAGVGPTETAAALSASWQLMDASLKLRVDARGYVALESDELVLPEPVAQRSRAIADSLGLESMGVLTYLANTIAVGGQELPYATVAAVEPWQRNGEPVPQPAPRELDLAPGGLALNAWAAKDLQLGSSFDSVPAPTPAPAEAVEITLDYFVVDAGGHLEETSATLPLERVVPLAGEAADPGWAPSYPGISDRPTLRSWDPPFPVDLDRMRDQDETYWEDHRATPKAFIALEDGQRLWSSRFGSLTSLRFRPPAGAGGTDKTDGSNGGEPSASLQSFADTFGATLRAQLGPGDVGIVLEDVRSAGRRAAAGGTDFTGLFIGFSFFLIVSALTLLSLVFRLGCEMRVRELGVLSASGFHAGAITGLLLREALVVIALGSLIGVAGGYGYAAMLLHGLRGLWSDAVNAPFLRLFWHPVPVLTALALTWLLAILTVYWVARREARRSPVSLLRGVTSDAAKERRSAGRRGRGSLWLAVVSVAAAVALLVSGYASDALGTATTFFSAAALLLVGGIALVYALLATRRLRLRRRQGLRAIFQLGARNWSRTPVKAVLTMSLFSSATFLIVTIASMRRDPTQAELRKESGNGGFALLARSTLPLHSPLGTQEGCEELELSQETGQMLLRSETYGFRLRPGDDTSCRNVYRPQSPRLLGAPAEFLERGGFAWASSLATTAAERENPWLLLSKRFPDGAVPAIGDANTVQWILKSGLGEDIVVQDGTGAELRLRLVALLSRSVFQGELLISEGRFLEKFPRLSGRGVFLFAVRDPKHAERFGRGLEADLSSYGFDVEATGDVLASYQAVENTYLSTFQVLGGLGFLLGTLGLGAVLYRNTLERRGELALLRAVGFSRAALAWMVLGENLFLLVLGLFVGTVSALAGVLPAQTAGGFLGAGVPWGSLSLVLGSILLCGMLSSALSLVLAFRIRVLAALRSGG